jgi:hypothetical protein
VKQFKTLKASHIQGLYRMPLTSNATHSILWETTINTKKMNKTNLINSIYKMWVAINWIATWYLEHQMIISLVVDIIEMILWLYDKWVI